MQSFKYKVIDHPSDTGIEVLGKDKTELFVNAAYGMMNMMFGNPDNKILSEPFPVKVSAEDIESLMVAWLSELLYIVDSKKVSLWAFKITKLYHDKELEAEVFGGKIGRVKTGIKAVTYSQMKIGEKNGVWSTRIIFDV
jgi:SHS2 domain-containing protein